MKELVLIRHAKSSWKDLSLPDFERPLNKRGKHDAPMMGSRLNSAGHTPDLILSSPAMRAATTAKVVAEILGFGEENITFLPELYLADLDTLFAAAHSLNDQHQRAMLFGHNPGMTDFANELTGSSIENVPTAGTVHISFDVSNWKDVRGGAGRLILFDYPKRST